MPNKKSQSSAITIIVASAIGLIIMVVLIALLTDKLGSFSKGIKGVQTCQKACEAIGADSGQSLLKEMCKTGDKRIVLPGSYSDVGEKQECCCSDKTPLGEYPGPDQS